MKRRKNYFSLLLCILCVGFFTTTAQAIPTVYLELSSTDIFVGDTFDLNVYADDVTDIVPGLWGPEPDEVLAFGFDTDYINTEFDYNGALVDTTFWDDSSLVPGTDVAGSTFLGISGNDILLASLSFTALQDGVFSLGILSDVNNPFEGLFTTSAFPFSIDMTNQLDVSVAPVPEPATMLLFATGLAGLVGLRRKSKKQ